MSNDIKMEMVVIGGPGIREIPFGQQRVQLGIAYDSKDGAEVLIRCLDKPSPDEYPPFNQLIDGDIVLQFPNVKVIDHMISCLEETKKLFNKGTML